MIRKSQASDIVMARLFWWSTETKGQKPINTTASNTFIQLLLRPTAIHWHNPWLDRRQDLGHWHASGHNNFCIRRTNGILSIKIETKLGFNGNNYTEIFFLSKGPHARFLCVQKAASSISILLYTEIWSNWGYTMWHFKLMMH